MWSVVVHYDGRPVTGEVPCTDWDAAGLVAAFFAEWGGGRVSVGDAVCSVRPWVLGEREPDQFAAVPFVDPADVRPIPGQLGLLFEAPPRPLTPKGGKVVGVEPIAVRSDLL